MKKLGRFIEEHEIFLNFKFYLFLIPLIILGFTFIFMKMNESFVVNYTVGSSFEQNAVEEFFDDFCKENSKLYILERSLNKCKFSFAPPVSFSSYKDKPNYVIEEISISYNRFEENILKLSYSVNYSQHTNEKKEDSGVLEFRFENYNKDHIERYILFKAVPHVSYPKGNPLFKIEPKNGSQTQVAGPHKALDFLSLGVMNIKKTGGSITSGKDWSYFHLKPSNSLTNIYMSLVEGKPILNKVSNLFPLFIYYSGITFMTVGYGDVTPVTNIARILAVFESFLGIVFMGLLSGSFFAHVVNLFTKPWKQFEKHLTKHDDWTRSEDPETGVESYYYIPNPEFKIIVGNNSVSYNEPWSQNFTDRDSRASTYSLKYKDTILYNFRFVYCDGARGIHIQPEQKVMYEGNAYSLPFNRYYYMIRNSFKDKLNKLIQSKSISELRFQINYFDSEEDALMKIEESFSGNDETLTCYRIEVSGGEYTLINRL
ncbi:ion channel [Bacteriovorax sp. BAL6_X]|uniref:potassium channel family protein n=1 Tax=Bacteriovorax sp. BAL6_X TaxID=1201290 RepID=UPI00038612B4|nr:potassium channel family protein [Bacteriovorax sp. BAL6_X]EPZ52383.1 ion channel [Bacteriovorax sp. BAL6_X]